MNWNILHVTDKLHPIRDNHMRSLEEQWFKHSQIRTSYSDFIPVASKWFKSSVRNNIIGWNKFPLIDVTMGNTHYIESFVLKHGWNGFQILKNEYAYYTLMGKHGVNVEDLEPNKPLMITLPHWDYCDLRPEWNYLLTVCTQKNIDIHIDMAWIITATDISIDLSHPCIKSFAMSLSKLNLQWSRVGLRWSRQKAMDSVTIFNDYYQDTNTVLTSVGKFFIDQIPRDYLWDTYNHCYQDVCSDLDLIPTKIIHVAKDKNSNKSLGVGNILSGLAPN